MSSARIVQTPAGYFRLTYSSGNGTSSRETVDVARRFGRMPASLGAITDIVADPCFADGSRYVDDKRPDVTVNGVSYSGTLYLISRGYFIGADYAGDNGWCVSYRAGHETETEQPFAHYWTGQHMTRYTDSRGFQAISEAGLRKLSGWVDSDARAMLADSDGLRAYWCARFESSAEYAVSDARRSLESANAWLGWAREYGSSRADVALPVWVTERV